MIIEREELKIEDEDSLLLFILRLYREDESYSTLFENHLKHLLTNLTLKT